MYFFIHIVLIQRQPVLSLYAEQSTQKHFPQRLLDLQQKQCEKFISEELSFTFLVLWFLRINMRRIKAFIKPFTTVLNFI